MRYLYGDSSPFPYPFDFLDTLQKFVESAARVVQLESEARTLQARSTSSASGRVRAVEELERFHQSSIRALETNAAREGKAHAAEYARQLVDYANNFVSDLRRTALATNERESATTRQDVQARRDEVHQALERFLLGGTLPRLESRLAGVLDGAHYNLSAAVTHPEGLLCAYHLQPAQGSAWQTPRRIGDLAKGTQIAVGIKRGFFSRNLQREMVVIDDYIMSGLDITDLNFELRLRKKAVDRDTMQIFAHREGGLVNARAINLQEEDPAARELVLSAHDGAHVERVWHAAQASLSELLEARDRVLSLQLDGEDVREHDLSIFLVERLVAFLAPTVLEIARRSPNANELSLKRELDDGRREEIYVTKSELLSHIAPLGDTERAIFGPLNLGKPVSQALPVVADRFEFDEPK